MISHDKKSIVCEEFTLSFIQQNNEKELKQPKEKSIILQFQEKDNRREIDLMPQVILLKKFSY